MPLTPAPARPVLYLGANLPQFLLLVLVNAFVGGMVGIERSILPTLAQVEFGLAERTAIVSFIPVFGITKALSNYLAGRLGESSAVETALRRVRDNLDCQVGWLRDGLATVQLDAENVTPAPIRKLLKPDNRGHTFY